MARVTSKNKGKGFCPIVALSLRLAVLYGVWMICRIGFYLLNRGDIGSLTWSEIPSLLHGSVVFDTVSILYVNALFIVLSLIPLRAREKRGYRRMLLWLFGITNSLALTLNLSDNVYFHYAQKRFTADELSYWGNDNNAMILKEACAENWYLVVLAVVLIGGMMWLVSRIRVRPSRIRSTSAYTLLHLPALALAAALTIGGIRGGFSRQTRPLTLSNATLYTPSSQKANLILSNPFCMLRTLGNQKLQYTTFFDQPTLDSLYTPRHASPTKDSLTLGRRNIVIFILESFSSEHSALLNPDLYPDGKGYTPYLDSLMRAGYYFSNAFANGHKSIEALPSVLSSIPSYRTPFVLMPQALAPMRPLPRLLDDEGYTTLFLNGSSRGSMGFGAYATQAGVTHYLSREDYEKAHGTADFDGYWGIWDEPFMQYMTEVLNQTPQPFMASVFTLSSHHPFVVPAKYDKLLPAGRTKIHKGVAYTDLAVRRFMEKASSERWFQHTIFVFVADHVSSERFAPKTMTPTGGSHIICLLYTPDGALRGIDRSVVQQIDLMPTLLHLIGYTKPYFAFGRDLLQKPIHEPMAVNFMNEMYQGITDSLVLFSDGSRTTAAYARTDTLQRHNLLNERTPRIDSAERMLEARMQQYYEHVAKGDYLPSTDTARSTLTPAPTKGSTSAKHSAPTQHRK